MNQMLDKREHSDTTHRAFSPMRAMSCAAPVDTGDNRGGGEPGPERQDVARHPATVLHKSNRIESLVEDLLTLAKVDAQGQLQLDVQDVDLEMFWTQRSTQSSTIYLACKSSRAAASTRPRRRASARPGVPETTRCQTERQAEVHDHRRNSEPAPAGLWSPSTITARSSSPEVEIECSSSSAARCQPSDRPMAVGVGSVWRSVRKSWAARGNGDRSQSDGCVPLRR